jgi:hypothetical protein
MCLQNYNVEPRTLYANTRLYTLRGVGSTRKLSFGFAQLTCKQMGYYCIVFFFVMHLNIQRSIRSLIRTSTVHASIAINSYRPILFYIIISAQIFLN